jgi:hypothetical protein
MASPYVQPGLRETLIRKQLDLALFARCYDDAYEALLNFPEGYVLVSFLGLRHASDMMIMDA